jgi:hypothetical protein
MQDIQALNKEKTKLEGELAILKKNNNDDSLIKLTIEIQRM